MIDHIGSLQIISEVQLPPSLLGPVLIFFGLELLVVGTTRAGFDQSPFYQKCNPRQRTAITAGFGLGIFACSIGALRQYDLLPAYVILLYSLGRAIEGIAAVIFYKKILTHLRWGSPGATSPGETKVGLLSFFVVLVGGGLVLTVFKPDAILQTTFGGLLVGWTMITAALTAIGLYWKFSSVAVSYPKGIVLGTILSVIGAEVYHFSSIWLDAWVVFFGYIGYAIGFGIAVSLWMKDSRS